MRLRISFACLALLGLSACASVGGVVQHKDSAPVSVLAAEQNKIRPMDEPWHDMALTGDIVSTEELAVALVRLPASLPVEWKQELVDSSRTYRVPEGEGFSFRPHQRTVFRAIVYRGDQFVAVHDAVIGPDGKSLLVLLPPQAREEYQGLNLLIASHDAYWVMTTQGQMVTLGKDPDLRTLRTGFFSEHPSPLRQVLPLRRSDPGGRLLFADLERLYPFRFVLRGVSYSGRPDTEAVLSQFTRADNALDRIVSCGSAPVSGAPLPTLVNPGLAIAVVRDVHVAANGCYKGDKH